jgi:5'-nucleotidase
MALILLTNDDGIEAEGLRVLEACLEGLADIVVVAPDRERSAVSHGLTLRSPLELKQLRPHHYTLSGTPADCVIYAVSNLMSSPPDLIISGINHGANLADDIMYSGTVAAAREASHRGIAGIAVSQAYDEKPINFDKGAKFIKGLIRTLLGRGLDNGLCLNVNIPVRKIKGVKITRQGCAPRFPHFNSLQFAGSAEDENSDTSEDLRKPEMMRDYHAIMNQFVSITPLQRDQTDYAMAETLLKDPPRLFRRFRFPRIGLIG